MQPNKAANFLESQFYLFLDRRELFLRDDHKRIYGTVMHQAGLGIRYPESGPRSRKGEDRIFCESLHRRHRSRITTLRRPELYVRVFHGMNTWNYNHHRATLKRRAVSVADLRAAEQSIRDAAAIFGIRGIKVRDINEVAFEII
jgi:hypothetical protein